MSKDRDDDLGLIRQSTPEEQAAALRTICAHSDNAEDALQVARMLGLTPSPRIGRHCKECGREMSRHPHGDVVGMAWDGLCGSCYQAGRRERKRVAR